MSTKITYNSTTTEVANGKIATLSCNGKKMKSDIVVEVPSAEDSAIPTEVSTEAEMTALLESGEVGGVYKYTGTTGTYENGALYVLEEETASLVSFTIEGTSYQAEEGMTWYEWCHSNYNTYGYSTLNKSGAYVGKGIGGPSEYVCKSASGGFSNCVVGNGVIEANATYYHYVSIGDPGN